MAIKAQFDVRGLFSGSPLVGLWKVTAKKRYIVFQVEGAGRE